MGKLLNRLTMVSCIVLFFFVVTAFYQVYILYEARGSSWEVITIINGVEDVVVENIWSYILGIILSVVLWLILISNYNENVELRRLLDHMKAWEETE